MRLPSEAYPIAQETGARCSRLTTRQAEGLAWWVYGATLAGSACQSAVVTALEPVVGAGHTAAVRQRLREWLYAGADKLAPCHAEIDVHACFAPLLGWVLDWWDTAVLPLAVDATALGDRVVLLSVSVLYRGSAIPVAWEALVANRPGAWVEPITDLLATLAPAVPPEICVLVLADRGLWSPRLWDALRRLRWHPLLRIRQDAIFQPTGRPQVRATSLVPAPGDAWVGTGIAFQKGIKRRPATLVAYWEADFDAPCLALTDLDPDAVGIVWYGLRSWIEAGFKALKSIGWHWERTQRTDPARVARHWLVLAVATLWVLATGTRVEDAEHLGRAPANLRTPPPPLTAPLDRTISVFARGLVRLRWQLLRARRLWSRIWLRPEPLPPTPPRVTLRVARGPTPLHF